jgi:hypothetical protein
MTHLTGGVPYLGLVTSPSGGHGMTHDLNVLGRGPFKKARPLSGSGRAGPAWPGFQD